MNELGRTGKFPDGKINEDDEGEIRIQIGRDKDKNLVVIKFGTPVAWLALKPNQAIAVATMLIKHAKALEKEEETQKGEG